MRGVSFGAKRCLQYAARTGARQARRQCRRWALDSCSQPSSPSPALLYEHSCLIHEDSVKRQF
jgi:hypothetical protein